ncbi:MAG: sigma-70 family RNA polymerase sigma factor, partial [Planctomycetota bacterium]
MDTPGTTTPHDLHLNPGDADKLHRLYEQFAPMVYSACLRRLSGRSDWADDATQGVFVLLMRQPRTFPNEQALAAWLHRAAYYACLHIVRDEKRRREREHHAMTDLASTTDPSTESATSTSWSAVSPHLDEALEELSESQRAAVLSHFFVGQSLSQIARDTGRSKVAIHGLVQRALENLRRHLARKGVAVPGLALATLMSTNASAAAPPLQSGVILMQTLAGGSTKAAVTAAAAGAHGMFVAAQLKAVMIAAGLLLGGAALVTGTIILTRHQESTAPQTPPLVGRTLLVDQRDPRAKDTNSGNMDAPLLTISAAMSQLKPGDQLIIKGGTYRESVAITVSGTNEAPIRVSAATGERVIISGADPIRGWKPCTTNELAHPNHGNLRWVDLPWKPFALSCAGGAIPLRVSQWSRPVPGTPDSVTLTITGSDRATVSDNQYFDQVASAWVGGDILLRRDIRKNDRIVASYTQLATITGYDQQRHDLLLQERLKAEVATATAGDPGETSELWYQITNIPALISGPGQYAVSKTANGYRCFIWPPDGVDLEHVRCDGVRRMKGVSARNVSQLTITGLEIAHIADNGIVLEQGSDNSVTNCVVHDCLHYSYSSVANGILLRNQRNSTIANCLIINNGLGIAVEASSGVTIQENAVGRSVSHGISMSRTTEAPTLLRNYVFDCWNSRGSNCDGLQTMLGVSRMRLENNLFLNVGVGWQSSETQDAHLINNVWAGTHTNGAINCGWSGTRSQYPNRGNVLLQNTILGGQISVGLAGRAQRNLTLSTPYISTDGMQDENLHWSPYS